MGTRNRAGLGFGLRVKNYWVRLARARICEPFKDPGNRFPAWRIRFMGSLNVYKYGLRLHRLAESFPWIHSWAP